MRIGMAVMKYGNVTGAQAAVHAADERQPDVVVIELQLPAHNGVEFLHEFRSYPEWQWIPVVVNTVLHPARVQATRQILQDELGVVEYCITGCDIG